MLELAWLGAKCKGKTLLVIEIFFTLHRFCTVTVQYWCSVSKSKHYQVFSAALLNRRKIQISLQQPDRDLTWRVASTTHLTLTSNQLWDLVILCGGLRVYKLSIKILVQNLLEAFNNNGLYAIWVISANFNNHYRLFSTHSFKKF